MQIVIVEMANSTDSRPLHQSSVTLGTYSLAFLPRDVVSKQGNEGTGLKQTFKGHTFACQQRTLEQWEIHGELSTEEHQRLIKLLCQLDGQPCLDHSKTTHRQDR